MLSKSVTTALLLLPSLSLAAINMLTLEDLPQLPQGQVENPACIAAYNATIECDVDILAGGSTDRNVTEADLDKLCTPTCLDSMRKWVRGGPGCEGEDYLNYFGLLNETFYDGYPMTVSDVQQYFITSAFHLTCLKDLNPKPTESKYCLLQLKESADNFYIGGIYNLSNPGAFCNNEENSCAAQSAYLWAPINVTYAYNETAMEDLLNSDSDSHQEPTMISFKEACPSLDTSKYPRREEDITAEMLNGDEPVDNNNNNNNNGGNDSPNNSGNNTDGESGNGDGSGAGSVMVSMSVVFGSAMMAAALLL